MKNFGSGCRSRDVSTVEKVLQSLEAHGKVLPTGCVPYFAFVACRSFGQFRLYQSYFEFENMVDVWHHISFRQGKNMDRWYEHVINEGVYSIAAIKHALYGLLSILPFAAMYANTDGDLEAGAEWLERNWDRLSPLKESIAQLCSDAQRKATAHGVVGRKARKLADNQLQPSDLRKVVESARAHYQAIKNQMTSSNTVSLSALLDTYYTYIFALLYTTMVPVRYVFVVYALCL